MNCERCGEAMSDEDIKVKGGLVKVKNVTVWYCTRCGRTEYRYTPNSCWAQSGKAQLSQ
jgi:YgiT-type zinc finger domain-containing protein